MHAEDRRLVLIVGDDSVARSLLARELIEAGDAVLLCGGPPGCAFEHDDVCVLLSAAQAVVLMPSMRRNRTPRALLERCAANASRAVFLGDPGLLTLPANSVVIRGSWTSRAVRDALAMPVN